MAAKLLPKGEPVKN